MKTVLIVIFSLLVGAALLYVWQKRKLIALAQKNADVIDLAGNITASVSDVQSIFSRLKGGKS